MKDGTSYNEDKNFLNHTQSQLPFDILSVSVDWIGDNLTPSQVFDENVILSWVKDNFVPEEVFDTKVLESWAEDNGFEEERP